MKRTTRSSKKKAAAPAKKVKIDPAVVIEEQEKIINALTERLSEHDENRRTLQERVLLIAQNLREQIQSFEDGTNELLEEKFTKEDERLQNALSEIQSHVISEEESDEAQLEELSEIINKAKIELTKKQTYKIREAPGYFKTDGDGIINLDLLERYKLEPEAQLMEGWVDLRKPENLELTKIVSGRFFIKFSCELNAEEEKSLQENNFDGSIVLKASLSKVETKDEDDEDEDDEDDEDFEEKEEKDEGDNEEVKTEKEGEGKEVKKEDEKKDATEEVKEYIIKSERGKNNYSFVPDLIEAGVKYILKVKMVCKGRDGEWSDPLTIDGFDFYKDSNWKECKQDLSKGFRYVLDKKNSMIVSKGCSNKSNTVIGTIALPPNSVTSWGIKTIKLNPDENYYYGSTYIGVAPFDISQSSFSNHTGCGWYLSCMNLHIYSPAIHYYQGKEYGFRDNPDLKVKISQGDIIGVVMDTKKGVLSFSLNGVNLGVAFDDVSLDKPLVPCVIFNGHNAGSVEFIPSKVKESTSKTVHVPSKVKATSELWDSLVLTWDEVEGASFYQVEVDGSKTLTTIKSNIFIQRNLLPNTEHKFRVRAAKEGKVSQWSKVLKEKTQEELFEYSAWRNNEDDFLGRTRYNIDTLNPRIAKNVSYNGCTLVGNAHLPVGEVVSWKIKLDPEVVLQQALYVGVAPSNIDVHAICNFERCGWYLECTEALLFSGPPQSVKAKEYGPRKKNGGHYVEKGDTVGVVMDTKKAELSFMLGGKKRGVAFDGIPLDEPLLPCVVIQTSNYSVELVI